MINTITKWKLTGWLDGVEEHQVSAVLSAIYEAIMRFEGIDAVLMLQPDHAQDIEYNEQEEIPDRL